MLDPLLKHNGLVEVIRRYQSKLQAQKARLAAMESTEAEEVKENLSPDLPKAEVPESWEGSTFFEKVKHAPPAAAPAAAPVGPFGFRLPPPGTVTRKDVGQANSSWQEAEDHPVNPAAKFLQRIGHDWQEPQEPSPEPPNDAWNASDFLAPPVARDPVDGSSMVWLGCWTAVEVGNIVRFDTFGVSQIS
eukprot:s1772_g4.t1